MPIIAGSGSPRRQSSSSSERQRRRDSKRDAVKASLRKTKHFLMGCFGSTAAAKPLKKEVSKAQSDTSGRERRVDSIPGLTARAEPDPPLDPHNLIEESLVAPPKEKDFHELRFVVRIFAVQLRNYDSSGVERRVEFIWDGKSHTTGWTAGRPQWKDFVLQFFWEPTLAEGQKAIPATTIHLKEHIERLSKVFCNVKVHGRPDPNAAKKGSAKSGTSPRAAPSPRDPQVVGQVNVDLATIANGPMHHDLPLVIDCETGACSHSRVFFSVRMSQVVRLALWPLYVKVQWNTDETREKEKRRMAKLKSMRSQRFSHSSSGEAFRPRSGSTTLNNTDNSDDDDDEDFHTHSLPNEVGEFCKNQKWIF